MDERADLEAPEPSARLEEATQPPVMLGAAGEYFFHYTSADVAFSHILPSAKIRMSPYPQMRDPTESKDWRFTTDNAQMGPVAKAVEGSLNGIRARATLLSLAVDAEGYQQDAVAPFGRGYARARMWEQYADNHAGVCLCFARQDFELQMRAELGKTVGPCGPVRYTSGGPAVSPARRLLLGDFAERVAAAKHDVAQQREDLGRPPTEQEAEALSNEVIDMLASAITERVTNHVLAHLDDLLLLKTDDWRSEHEYRFVSVQVEPGFRFVPYGDTLRAVIVGERFPAWQVAGAELACMDSGAELRRLDWRGGFPSPRPLGWV